jgi:hypothetical protein
MNINQLLDNDYNVICNQKGCLVISQTGGSILFSERRKKTFTKAINKMFDVKRMMRNDTRLVMLG